MDKLQLKIGWVLVLVWMISITVIVTNYRSTSVMMAKVELLGDSVDELRSRLFFDAPYRIHFADQQQTELKNIVDIKNRLDQEQGTSWFEPDIHQLLLTSERFIEHSQAFIANELALVDLIDQIQTSRDSYLEQPEMALLYYKLSANIFEAMFSAQSMTSTAYRHLDELYALSVKLPAQDKQRLQSALAKTSLVMGGYAQGAFLVDKLTEHKVHGEVMAVEEQYHNLLLSHLKAGALLSGLLLLSLMLMWHSSLKRKQTNQAQQETSPSEDESKQAGLHLVSVDEVEPQEVEGVKQAQVELKQSEQEASQEIDFATMLDSLGDDREAMCMLLEVFIEDHANDVEDIGKLLTDAPDEAMRKAHSLKGVGGNLGAANLREAAGKIESAIKDDVTVVPELLQELDNRLSQALKEARAFLDQESAA